MRRLLVSLALAHAEDAPLARTSDAVETLALVAIACAGVLYTVGLRRLWRAAGGGLGVRRIEAASYALGLLALAGALAPPLDRAAVASFTAHMAQHQLLLLVAPPLLVLGRPHLVALFALAPPERARVAAAVRRPRFRAAWRALTAPLAATALHAAALWAWHVPAAWEAALALPPLHAVQHVSFFATALLFWWAMLQGRWGRAGYGVAVLYVFVTAAHTSALGALLAYARRLWYPANGGGAAAADALGDQQLGGLVMWIPSGAFLVLLAVGLLAAWLGELERRGARYGPPVATPRARAPGVRP